MQIVLFGQPELDRTLALPQFRQLLQRISFSYRLPPLDADGTRDYIRHRLHKAGREGQPLFSERAQQLLVETDLPFRGIGFDHFLPSDTQIIITGAVPDERQVFEINGAPAAQEYARLVGCHVDDLSPQIFAENPLLVQYRDSLDRDQITAASDGISALGQVTPGAAV